MKGSIASTANTNFKIEFFKTIILTITPGEVEGSEDEVNSVFTENLEEYEEELQLDEEETVKEPALLK